LPLPGNPGGSPGLAHVISRATDDARALVDGGVDGIIIENFGDVPFSSEPVPPSTIACMTRAALAILSHTKPNTLGINVLRNDPLAAIGIAHAVDADFIRVNVHTGAMITDQGLIEGRARNTLLERQRLQAQTRIAADVHVKHASPIGEHSITQAAQDTLKRGCADAIILSGSGTGQPVNYPAAKTVRDVVPESPLWLGSGLTPDQIQHCIGLFDAVIVGTALHQHADLDAPIDVKRVTQIAKQLASF